MLEKFVTKIKAAMQGNAINLNRDTLSPACRELLDTYSLDDEEIGAGVLAVGVYPELCSVVIFFQVPIATGDVSSYNGFTARVVKVTFIDVPDASISYGGSPLEHNQIITLPPNAESIREHSIDELQLKCGNYYHLFVCEAEDLTVMFPFKNLVYEEVNPSMLSGTKSPI